MVIHQDLYRQTLEDMVDPCHPLVVLARRIPWDELESRVEPPIVRTLQSSDRTPWRDLADQSLGYDDLPLSDPAALARAIEAIASETTEHLVARH